MTEPRETPLSLAAVLQDIYTKAEIRYPVALDPQDRVRLAEAQAVLEKAESDYKQALKRTELAREDAYMSDQVPDPSTQTVEDALAEVERIRETAPTYLIVLNGWLGKKYDEVVRSNFAAVQAAQKGERPPFTRMDELTAYLEAAFIRVETPSGEPVEGTLEEVLNLMTPGDRGAAANRIIEANERPSGLPF